MARLTFPTRSDLTARLTDGTNPERLDTYTEAERNGDTLIVMLTDPLTDDALTITHVTGRWDLHPTSKALDTGQPAVLPETLVARANRLMSPDGVSVQRDWRTKTHVLRAAPRRVLPLTLGETASAILTPRGWTAGIGTTPSPSTSPVLTPSSPTALPAQGAGFPAPSAADPQVTPSTQPVRGAGSQMPMSGIPAAYRGKVVLSKQARTKWLGARAVHRTGEPEVIAMVGPSGAGKTHAVHALAAEEGLEVVKFDASGVIEPGDWFGTVTLDKDGTRFVPSDLLMALTLPGPRVLLIDEANRANMRALNAMLPVFDGSGTVTIPQSGKRERINPEVQVVVTANIGTQFLATEPLDEAIRTRVSTWIEVEHLAEDQERQLLLDRVPGLTERDAANLASLGAMLRSAAENGQHAPTSTRQLLAAARKIAAGMPPRLAVDAAVTDSYTNEGGGSSERAKIRTHVAGIQWKEPKENVTYTSTSGLCQCGHDPAEHGIGVEVSTSTHCRFCARQYPGSTARQCMAYSPVMVPGAEGVADQEVDDLAGY